MAPEAYKTYGFSAPLSTHWRAGTCEEAACPHHLHGWETRVDLSTEQGQYLAGYIRTRSGRQFEEVEPGAFRFPPGQDCFRSGEHRVRVERPELFMVRNGDWRRAERPQQLDPQVWLDDFREHQDRLATRLARG
jgi:hypothetical protein